MDGRSAFPISPMIIMTAEDFSKPLEARQASIQSGQGIHDVRVTFSPGIVARKAALRSLAGRPCRNLYGDLKTSYA
jgi:hypothetical protein